MAIQPRFRAILLGVTMLALVATFARADWPHPRGDNTRSGVSGGSSNLVEPVPYWRYYLGGDVEPRGAAFMDIDSDSLGELLIVSGGRLVAKERTDILLWETPSLGLRSIVGIVDLDGDGAAEIAVQAARQIFVVEPQTGRILWEQPGDDFGTLGGARIADLDGDSIPELFVQECGCCRINNGNTGFVYSFAGGFASARRLWTLPSVRCGGNRNMAVIDATGDGRLEVTLGENTRIHVLDGETGTEVAVTEDIGERVAESVCSPVNLDGDPGDELICIQSNRPPNRPEVGHRAFALDIVPAAGRIDVLWQRDIGEVNARVTTAPGMLMDLDGNGSLELTLSGVLAASETTVTYVLDAASGDVLGELAGQRFAGATSLGGEGRAMLFTTEGENVRAWWFERGEAEPFTSLFTLDDARVLGQPRWDVALRTHVHEELVTLDLTGDGMRELVVVQSTPSERLVALDLAGDPKQPVEAANYSESRTARLLSAWVLPPQAQDEPGRLLIASSNGIMSLLDSTFGLRSNGVRFGGYYPKGDWRNLHLTPVVADLGTGQDSVIITDSLGTLVRLDPKESSLAAPPVPAWRVPDTSGPVILSEPGAEDAAIACQETLDTGDHRVIVLDGDGRERWSATVGGMILSDLIPGNIDGDGVPDLVVEWGRRSDIELRHRAYSGATGEVLWNAVPHAEGTTRFPAGGAILDWNEDGIDDYIYQHYRTRVLSGADGSMLAETSDDNLFYFMPIVLDLDGDEGREIVLQGGFHAVRVLDHDLASTLWVSGEEDRPYPYGAVASGCADGIPRLVAGSLAQSSRLKVIPLSGPEAGVVTPIVLAGGRSFADEDSAISTGVFMGQLTSTSIHTNLMGDRRPIAVVGSDDGWLYGVDSCTASMVFAVPFSAAVGAIAFGDTDGDGRDEILAAVADGYLYALKQAPIRSPGWVRDLDPWSSSLDDIDEIGMTSSLRAMWEPVEEADGYLVALIDKEENTFMTSPNWIDVGRDTSFTFTDLALEAGAGYIVAVRAVSAEGPSPDTLSDGVILLEGITAGDEPVGQPHGGCFCTSSPSVANDISGAFTSLILIALALVMVIRPRQRSHRRTKNTMFA